MGPGRRCARAGGPVRCRRAAWLSALHPRYFRLLVDWAALQPSPGSPPASRAPGRRLRPRRRRPAAPTRASPASSRRSPPSSGPRAPAGEAAPQVVVDLLGAPAWATLPAARLRSGRTPPRRATLAPARARRLSRADRATWSRSDAAKASRCRGGRRGTSPTTLASSAPSARAAAPTGAPLAPDAYAELARAMARRAEGLGARRAAAARRARRLRERLAPSAQRRRVRRARCPRTSSASSRDWSVHAYAAYGPRATGGGEPGRGTRAGARRTRRLRGGRARLGDRGRRRRARARAGRAAAAPAEAAGRLPRRWPRRSQRWRSDPRVAAIFQYTFREDPAYPVGLERIHAAEDGCTRPMARVDGARRARALPRRRPRARTQPQ